MLGLNKAIYEKTAAYGHSEETQKKAEPFRGKKTDKANIFNK